ncbi:hypothetical protein LptCag_1472 [Leptospirillum ferriphilum]|uniref:Uncharacterized protein n=1 Tax=Leptospirillum ferriphilum TaxID=178606 RepID=A0A094WDP1_9BACT|nr:hypothetical protein LptCag_1472 [Leptospirillum ferriphilum]
MERLQRETYEKLCLLDPEVLNRIREDSERLRKKRADYRTRHPIRFIFLEMGESLIRAWGLRKYR